VIDPRGIPSILTDVDAVAGHATELQVAGVRWEETGAEVDTTWKALPAFYSAPESPALFGLTAPVRARTADVGAQLISAGQALSVFALEVREIKQRLEVLRAEAAAFVASVGGQEYWQDDTAKADEHNLLLTQVSTQVAAWETAQRNCANAITHLYNTCITYVADNGDGNPLPGEFGLTPAARAELAHSAQGLDWGTAEEGELDQPWYLDVLTGTFADGLWGDIKGMGAMVGIGGSAKDTWIGLGTLALSLNVPAHVLNSRYDLPGLKKGTLTRTLKETGKGLVAWDEWGRNPSRAAGTVGYTVASALIPTKLGAPAKGAAVAEDVAGAAGDAGKVSHLAGAAAATADRDVAGKVTKLPTIEALTTNARRLPHLDPSQLQEPVRAADRPFGVTHEPNAGRGLRQDHDLTPAAEPAPSIVNPTRHTEVDAPAADLPRIADHTSQPALVAPDVRPAGGVVADRFRIVNSAGGSDIPTTPHGDAARHPSGESPIARALGSPGPRSADTPPHDTTGGGRLGTGDTPPAPPEPAGESGGTPAAVPEGGRPADLASPEAPAPLDGPDDAPHPTPDTPAPRHPDPSAAVPPITDESRIAAILRGSPHSRAIPDAAPFTGPLPKGLGRDVVSVQPMHVDPSEPSFIVDFADDTKGIYTPASETVSSRGLAVPPGGYPAREVANGVLDRHLGFHLVPPTEWWDGPAGRGSLQGLGGNDTMFGAGPYHYTSIERERMAVLDYVAGNMDGKLRNYFSGPMGRLTGFARGWSFPEADRGAILSDFVTWHLIERQPFSLGLQEQLVAADVRQLAADLRATGLSRDAVDRAMARLEEVRARGRITGENWDGAIRSNRPERTTGRTSDSPGPDTPAHVAGEPTHPTSADAPSPDTAGPDADEATGVGTRDLPPAFGLDVVGVESLRQGQYRNSTFKVRFADGSEGIYKPISGEERNHRIIAGLDEMAHREVAAAYLDRDLGLQLIPDTQMWDGPQGPGSLQKWVPNSTDRAAPWEYTAAERQRMAVLDYVAGSMDRRPVNYLSDAEDRLVAIDHGSCFPPDARKPLKSDFVAEMLERRRPLGDGLVEQLRAVDIGELEVHLREAGLTDGEVAGAVARLEEVRANGMITGEAWHGAILEANDDVAKEATPEPPSAAENGDSASIEAPDRAETVLENGAVALSKLEEFLQTHPTAYADVLVGQEVFELRWGGSFMAYRGTDPVGWPPDYADARSVVAVIYEGNGPSQRYRAHLNPLEDGDAHVLTEADPAEVAASNVTEQESNPFPSALEHFAVQQRNALPPAFGIDVDRVEILDHPFASSAVLKVHLADGTEAVYKPILGEDRLTREVSVAGQYMAVREVAAARLDRDLGLHLVPETEMWNGPLGPGSLQQWVRDSGTRPFAGDYTDSEQDRMAVLDYVAGNADRSAFNYLSDAEGRLVAIDNGCCFPPWSLGNEVKSDFVLGRFREPLNADLVAQLRLVDVEQVAGHLRETGLSERAVAGAIARLEEVRRDGTISGSAWLGGYRRATGQELGGDEGP
jgi:uncharacterized protein YoaH (UPF0181 family)